MYNDEEFFFTSGINEVRYLGYVSMYKNKTKYAMPVTTNIGGMFAYCICHGKRKALLPEHAYNTVPIRLSITICFNEVPTLSSPFQIPFAQNINLNDGLSRETESIIFTPKKQCTYFPSGLTYVECFLELIHTNTERKKVCVLTRIVMYAEH